MTHSAFLREMVRVADLPDPAGMPLCHERWRHAAAEMRQLQVPRRAPLPLVVHRPLPAANDAPEPTRAPANDFDAGLLLALDGRNP